MFPPSLLPLAHAGNTCCWFMTNLNTMLPCQFMLFLLFYLCHISLFSTDSPGVCILPIHLQHKLMSSLASSSGSSMTKGNDSQAEFHTIRPFHTTMCCLLRDQTEQDFRTECLFKYHQLSVYSSTTNQVSKLSKQKIKQNDQNKI